MTTRNYGLLKNLDDLKKLVDKVSTTKALIGFDIETGYNGPDKPKGAIPPHGDTFIAGFSLTVSPKWARYVPLRHDSGPNLPEEAVWEIIKPLLEQPRIVAHNAKFEKRHVRKYGIELGIAHDSMLQAFILAEFREIGLKYLIDTVFNHKMTEIEDLFPDATDKELEALRFNRLELSTEVVKYACEDAAWCLALHEHLHPKIVEGFPFIYKLEMGIMELMCDAEDRGMTTDWEGIARCGADAVKFKEHLVAEVRDEFEKLLGRDMSKFNLNSTQQVRKVLFDPPPDGLGLKPAKMTKGGKPRKDGKPPAPPAPSTDKISLKRLAKKHEPVRKLLNVRNVTNLANRTETWLSYADSHDGKIHSSYGQVQVPTGRFNASDPPIQQAPKAWRFALRGPWGNGDLKDAATWQEVVANTEEWERFEGVFRDYHIATPGHYFLGFDYSQIELRALAGLSQEKALLDAFREGKDVHSTTAAQMLNKRLLDIQEHERAIGKTMNFALIYGMGPGSLADRLGIPMDEAQRLYDAYFEGFPSVTSWMARTKREASFNYCTMSYFGRKAAIWELQSTKRGVRAKGERAAGNYPVQGWAADYMKIAMLRVKAKLEELGWYKTKVWLVANLHDALTFEVVNDLPPLEVVELLRPIVEFPVPNYPKIVSDWEFSQTWGTAFKLKPGVIPEFLDGEWTVAGAERVNKEDEEEDEDEVAPVVTEPQPDPQAFVVKIDHMPSPEQFQAFLTLLQENPGVNTMTIQTPEGNLDVSDITTSLCVEDDSRLAMVFGGAQLFKPATSVDTDALAAGISL